jgi:hypothetical protein
VRLLRRLFACALVLLVLGEASGVARAFGPGSTVRCCCGPHAAARPCPCPDCPVTRLRKPRHADEARLTADHNCAGTTVDDPGILQVLAVVAPPLAPLAAPQPRGTIASSTPQPLRTRAVDIGRPPP